MVLYLRLDGRDKRGQSVFRGQLSLCLSLSLATLDLECRSSRLYLSIAVFNLILSSPILPTLNINPGSFQESVELWSIRVDATP